MALQLLPALNIQLCMLLCVCVSEGESVCVCAVKCTKWKC